MLRRETRRSNNGDSKLLEQQLTYYRERAPEYDEWFLREGRYDRGAQHRSEWFREVVLIERELHDLVLGKDVLELAAGTGLWTKRLANSAKRVVAVDGSPEAIEINRHRLRSSEIEYEIADIFTWQPRRTFDVVFFSFWLSHVPAQRFETFWDTVRLALNPRGNAFLSTAYSSKHQLLGTRHHWTGRVLSVAGSTTVVRSRLSKCFTSPQIWN